MILIFGHFPDRENEQEGMVQRISAIDHLLSSFERTYIATPKIFDTAHKIKHPLKWMFGKLQSLKRVVDDKVTVFCEIDERTLDVLMAKAQAIYIHSLYFLQNIPPHLLQKHGAKTFFDIHGCVVEESIQMQVCAKEINALIRAEENAFQHIGHLIAVSDRMAAFYKTKYAPRGSFYTLPIFSTQQRLPLDKPNASGPLTIVYSGGTQIWQNVSLMVATISETFHKYSYLVVTPHVEVFESMLEPDVRKKITIVSVPKNEVAKYYAQADFGFVLRDDNIVNAVSCPTKIIEYIQNGIVPVVLQPEIGDFNAMGYRYVLNETLLQGNLPSRNKIEEMRTKNDNVMQRMAQKKNESQTNLLAAIQSLLGSKE
jgi:hypothetical protein